MFIYWYIPSIFKKGAANLLLKGENKNYINNYKLIIPTNSISKIIEISIKHRFIIFFNNHKLINHSQFDFQKLLTTNDHLTKVTTI